MRPVCILGLLLFAPLCGALAHAAEVYAYLGSDFTSAYFPYTTSDFISGLFTTSIPLGPDLVGETIVPATYSFSDGSFDWTSSNSSISSLTVTTDAYGTLESASVSIVGSDPGLPFPGATCEGCHLDIATSGDSIGEEELGIGTTLDGYASNSTPGIWGPDFDPVGGSPEPATAGLVATALLAFAFLSRKRIAQGVR